jgi:hypothetical protein
LITGTVRAGEEISGATGIVVVVVVVDVVDVVVVLVGVVVVIGALLPPEHAAMERHNPTITIAFFDIFLISLRYLI